MLNGAPRRFPRPPRRRSPSATGPSPPSDLESRLRGVVATHLDVAPNRLCPEARLGEDLGVDSLSAIDLAMALEDEFDIFLPEEVVADVRTYRDVVTVVAARAELAARTPG